PPPRTGSWRKWSSSAATVIRPPTAATGSHRGRRPVYRLRAAAAGAAICRRRGLAAGESGRAQPPRSFVRRRRQPEAIEAA
ncbi:hypothetical protein CKJ89_37670, partial [Klebsiella pneumoniae]